MAVEEPQQAPIASQDEAKDFQPGERATSALHDNIARNGAQSYYYAHKPRETGEPPAPLPVHVPLDTTSHPLEGEIMETIFNYQFLDESKVVKVYIPLEGVGAATTDASVSCDFQPRSLEVCIRDYKPNRVLRLYVKELHAAIKPEGSSFKRLANKVVITLSKEDSSHWSKLAK